MKAVTGRGYAAGSLKTVDAQPFHADRGAEICLAVSALIRNAEVSGGSAAGPLWSSYIPNGGVVSGWRHRVGDPTAAGE